MLYLHSLFEDHLYFFFFVINDGKLYCPVNIIMQSVKTSNQLLLCSGSVLGIDDIFRAYLENNKVRKFGLNIGQFTPCVEICHRFSRQP